MTTTPCIYPPNAPGTQGYVRLMRGGRFHLAHRWAWEQANGPIPDGLMIGHVCHDEDKSCPGGPTCPHRACWNVEHLRPMTHIENMEHARHRCPIGPDTPVIDLASVYPYGYAHASRR